MTARIRWVSLAMLAGVATVNSLAAQYVGEVSASGGLGYGAGVHPAAVSAGGTVSLSLWTRRFTLGPEGLYQRLGQGDYVLSLGGVARVPLAHGPVRPFATVGLGYYSWRARRAVSLDLLAGSLGGGAELGSPRRHVAWTMEGRVHSSLQRTGGAGSRRFVTMAAGMRVRW